MNTIYTFLRPAITRTIEIADRMYQDGADNCPPIILTDEQLDAHADEIVEAVRQGLDRDGWDVELFDVLCRVLDKIEARLQEE